MGTAVRRAAHVFRQKLIAGFLALFPLAVTFFVARALLAFLDGIIGKYITKRIPGLGLLTLVAILLLTGFLVTSFLGRRIFKIYDQLLSRVPFARTIYVGSKQLIEALSPSSRRGFQRVVLIEYPRKRVYAVGFVTRDGFGEVQARTAEHVVNVFIPTTPNPTSGFLLLVPRDELIPLSMTVEDAIKLVVSGGLVVPEWESPHTPLPAAPPELVPTHSDKA